jgi:hypothetical protein
MTQTRKIIYTNNYALMLGDTEGKKNCWVLVLHAKTNDIHFIESLGIQQENKEIIGHRPLTDAPILTGVPLLPEIPNKVQELADAEFPDRSILGWVDSFNPYANRGFVTGYNKAQELYYAQLADIRNKLTPLLNMVQLIERGHIVPTESFKALVEQNNAICKDVIEYLSSNQFETAARPTHFEYEKVCDQCADDEANKSCYCHFGSFKMKPKTITNSQNEIQIVGKYTTTEL